MKSRDDVARLMDEIFAQCQATRDAGQKEYAHEEENALRNFEQTGADLSISREKVWWIFAKKHWDGVLAWINGHRSQREDVRGRIKDLIVHLVLLWAMVEDETPLPTGRCGTRNQLQYRCEEAIDHPGDHIFARE